MGHQGDRVQRSLGKSHHKEGNRDRVERGKDLHRDSRVVDVQGTKTSVEVTGLKLFSHYELAVAAYNSKGEGPPSPAHRFNTPEGGEHTDLQLLLADAALFILLLSNSHFLSSLYVFLKTSNSYLDFVQLQIQDKCVVGNQFKIRVHIKRVWLNRGY